jgi:hypothetical protein
MLAIVKPLTEMKGSTQLCLSRPPVACLSSAQVRDTSGTNIGKSQQPENVSNGLAHGDSSAAHV